MSGVAGATGLITTAVGLGVTLGALGLAFNLVDRSVARTQEQVSGRKPRRRERDLFDFSNGGRRKTSRRRGSDDIFDLGLTQRPSKRGRKFRSDFGDDFNIFAV